jgi:type IV secretory pathway component VirB8
VTQNYKTNKVPEDIDIQKLHAAIESGEFFADSFDWYFFRYVKPFCERTTLLIFAICALFMPFSLYEMVGNSFPLVVSKPIFSPVHEYQTKLIKLRFKPKESNYDPDIKTIDDSVIKYLVGNYIIDREGFDFSTGEIEDVNDKINRIKNRSNDLEFSKFYGFMSEENPQSPINFFGKKTRKTIKIDSIRFNRSTSTKLIDYFKNELPLEAVAKFTATTVSVSEDGQRLSNEEKFLVKIGYEYEPIKANSEERSKSQKTLKFIVRKYELFRVN